MAHHRSIKACKKYIKKCVNSHQNCQNWPKRAEMGKHFAFSMLKSTPVWKQVQAVAVMTKISYGIELKMLRFRVPKSQLIPISLIFSHLKNLKNEASHCGSNSSKSNHFIFDINFEGCGWELGSVVMCWRAEFFSISSASNFHGGLPIESLRLDQSFQNNLMKTDFSCRAFWISMPLVTLWTQISLKYAAEAVIRVQILPISSKSLI